MQIINQLITFPEKNYHNKVCLTPFDTIQIGPTGNVSLCGCSGWMPSIIGNILNNTLDEILNSSAAKKIRQSIRDGSYRYCNEKTCGVIVTGLHYQAQRVGEHLQEVMRTMGMKSPINGILAWQRTTDMSFEHPDNDLKYIRDFFSLDDDGRRQIKNFKKSFLGEDND